MPTSVDAVEPVDAGGSPRSLSAWSVISLVLFALATLALLLLLASREDLALGADDPSRVVVVLLVIAVLGADYGCTLLGVLTGWVGVRRSRGYPELPRAGLALNSALLLLQLVLSIVLLSADEAGAKRIAPLMIVIVGTVFAVLAGATGFVRPGRRVNDSARSDWPHWWVWVLGAACGMVAVTWIVRLMQTG